MSHTVPDQHVELVLVVLDSEDHGHGLTNFDDSRHFRGPWSLSNLESSGRLQIVSLFSFH
jgi:hypothetical protein